MADIEKQNKKVFRKTAILSASMVFLAFLAFIGAAVVIGFYFVYYDYVYVGLMLLLVGIFVNLAYVVYCLSSVKDLYKERYDEDAYMWMLSAASLAPVILKRWMEDMDPPSRENETGYVYVTSLTVPASSYLIIAIGFFFCARSVYYMPALYIVFLVVGCYFLLCAMLGLVSAVFYPLIGVVPTGVRKIYPFFLYPTAGVLSSYLLDRELKEEAN